MAKGINIFDSAKGKPKPSSSAKDKPTVEVDGIEAQLNELQNLKTQIANLETELDVVTDEIKTIAKEKFVELYLENGRNPNTFLLKDGSGCVMVIPTDKYISIKDEDRANQLIETYGEDIVTIDEKYYFNPEVLERNMKAIEKLIRDAKSISDADKQNLLIREVKYSVTKGTIDELYDYGEAMEAVINDIQPIITLKNCGGKMAEGGTDGEFIANVYDDYDAEVGTTVKSMYADGGMMANGGRVLVGKFDEQQLRNKEDKKAVEKAQKETGLKYIDSKIVKKGGKMMLEVYLISDEEYHNSSKFADGGMMAKGGKVELIVHGKSRQYSMGTFDSIASLKRYVKETDMKQPYTIKKLEDGGIKIGDKIRIVQGLQGDYKSPKYANKIYEVINVRGNDFDVRSSEGYTETFKIGSSNYQKYAYGGMMAKGGMTQNEKYDLLYNFVDEKMIEGDEQAERIINGELPNGYNDLYDFVDEKMIEGDSEAAKLLNKINKYALGGFFGNSRYNTGRSWHLDHARHNKKESYEKPLNKRSRRFKRK
jgi:hypothetical protein